MFSFFLGVSKIGRMTRLWLHYKLSPVALLLSPESGTLSCDMCPLRDSIM